MLICLNICGVSSNIYSYFSKVHLVFPDPEVNRVFRVNQDLLVNVVSPV